MWRVPRLHLDSGLFRRRGAALIIALALEALLILLLLFMIPPTAGNKKPGTTTIFSVETPGEEKADASKDKAEAKARPQAATAARRPVVPPPEVPPPPVPPTPNGPLPFIVMTRQEYRDAQISNLPQRPSDPGESAATSGPSGSMAGDTPLAGGKGPGGEPLYAAEWYRRPRQAELETYLPRRWAREGSGLIACRTVARYHVDSCKILGESPKGSGYGYAVLQASFQFLVRPPRVGGKEMVGAWVSIRIDYTVMVK